MKTQNRRYPQSSGMVRDKSGELGSVSIFLAHPRFL